MINVKTYGKLYIAGEYQVLNTGGNAIIYGIDRHIYFEIEKANKFNYITRNQKYYFDYVNQSIISNNNHQLINLSIETAFKYLESLNIKITPFKINIESELESDNGIKYGFGSSSAIISGIIKVILKYFTKKEELETIFKLSVITQIKANDLSSGGDLAAAIYGNWVYYERYDLKYVLNNLENENLIKNNWPNLVIENINVKDINVLAAWSKQAYKTKSLNKTITFKESRYANRLVKVLKYSLENSNYELINKAIIFYDKWLKNILEGTKLYIDKFTDLKKIVKRYELSSKISGAGGGDSAIILYKSDTILDSLLKELKNINFEPFIL